jgi:putative hydrolase of the HAD superfamily
MINAVLFDLDGTLRHNNPRGSEVFPQHAAELGLRVREEDVERAMRWEHYYWASSHELLDDQKRYGRMTDEHWKRYSFRELVALGASTAQAAELAPKMNEYMLGSFKPQSVVPDEVLGVLQTLNDEGLKLAVVSNRAGPIQDEIAGLGLARYFGLTLASGEIDAWKPDPEIFLHACRRLQAEPAEAAYVGDNYFADVIGARRAGLMPVLYDPRGIFDDPGCAVIRSFTELPPVLGLEGEKLAAMSTRQ